MFRNMDKKYFHIFLTVSSCVLFYFFLTNFSSVFGVIRSLFRICSPLLYGFAIAYILNPLMKFCSRGLSRVFPKWKRNTLRAWSITFSYLFLLLALGAILFLIIPQMVESVGTLVMNISDYTRSFSVFVDNQAARLNALFMGAFSFDNTLGAMQSLISRGASFLVSMLPDAIDMVTRVTAVIGYIIFGLFFSVYMLFDKERLCARIKKMVYAILREENANKIIFFFRDTNESVGNFINGKLISSCAIGICSFFVFLLFGIEFPGLLAVIIGVTDIIPVFGPIIGAIPCSLILLIAAPRQFIPFLIMIIVIQQIEGNVISPKILGHVTGISGFWVMVVITVGGGLFGVSGMILGVPIFTVFYRLLTRAVNSNLAKKNMTVETGFYENYPAMPPREEETEKRKKCRLKQLFWGKNKRKKVQEAEGEARREDL